MGSTTDETLGLLSLTRTGEGTTRNKQMKQVIQSTVIRPVNVIASLLATDANGGVQLKAGSDVSADELAEYAADRANAAQSATIAAVNTVRLARLLPNVEIPAVMDGETVKSPAVKKSAFDYVLGKLKGLCATDSTFQNVKGLIECADIADKNNLPCSPFAVKEALGYMRAAGVLDKDTLKLKAGDSVTKALKDGAKVNAVRPVIGKAKEKANAKAAKENKALPFPKAGAPAKDETKEDLVLISTHIQLAVKAVTKLSEAGKGAEAKAEAVKVKAEIEQLAKLAGLVIAPVTK